AEDMPFDIFDRLACSRGEPVLGRDSRLGEDVAQPFSCAALGIAALPPAGGFDGKADRLAGRGVRGRLNDPPRATEQVREERRRQSAQVLIVKAWLIIADDDSTSLLELRDLLGLARREGDHMR